MTKDIRINKRMADLGLSSRREADVLIEAKKVLVNGKLAKMGQKVNESDDIVIKGATQEKKYLAYYKGRGIITHSPDKTMNEVDIAMRLKKDYKITDVYPLGRLDKDSEGLIILTNDGRLTKPLLDPESNHEKEYEVTVDKPINNWFLKHMAEGVKIERYTTKPAKVELLGGQSKTRFSIILTEGKKHQIRRMCAALGYQVQSLKRVRIMNTELGGLKPNQYRKITEKELESLFKDLKLK